MIRMLTAAALVLASFAGAASAETVKVGYSDLNLSNDAGMRTLNHRVAAAITEVCGAIDPNNLSEAVSIQTCRRTAKSSATQQIAAVVSSNERSAQRSIGMKLASR